MLELNAQFDAIFAACEPVLAVVAFIYVAWLVS